MNFFTSNWLFFLLLVGWAGCRDASVQQASTPATTTFTLADSTVLTLPAAYALSEKEQMPTLERQIYDFFVAGLSKPPLQAKYFKNTLTENQFLGVFQLDYAAYNQNLAALMNSDWTQKWAQLDEQMPCFSINKVESMQYASKEWNALKFKFQLKPLKGDCNVPPVFATIFYYNGHRRVFYLLEVRPDEQDLDQSLRRIQLGAKR